MLKHFAALSILLLAGILPASAQPKERTPAVPPAPNCDVAMKGDGKWVGDPIIRASSTSRTCTQTYKCTGEPSPKPNVACKFTVQHTSNLMRSGQCVDNSCAKCGDPPSGSGKEKCEWSLKKN
jgi:hypothetical protein